MAMNVSIHRKFHGRCVHPDDSLQSVLRLHSRDRASRSSDPADSDPITIGRVQLFLHPERLTFGGMGAARPPLGSVSSRIRRSAVSRLTHTKSISRVTVRLGKKPCCSHFCDRRRQSSSAAAWNRENSGFSRLQAQLSSPIPPCSEIVEMVKRSMTTSRSTHEPPAPEEARTGGPSVSGHEPNAPASPEGAGEYCNH